MKKAAAILLGVLLTLTMSTTVFGAAQNSPTVYGFVTGTSTARNSAGQTINMNVSSTIPAADQAAVSEIKTAAKLSEVLGSAYTANMSVVDVKAISFPSGTSYPVTATFSVTGMTANTKAVVMGYNPTTGKWVALTTQVVDGKLVVTIPEGVTVLAFAADKTTMTTTSPKTGEVSPILPAALISAAAVGMFFFLKKKTA